MKILLIVGAALLAGCQTIGELRADASSGQIGCPPEQISTADHKQLTWTASCKGKTFYCHTGDGTSCKEALVPSQ